MNRLVLNRRLWSVPLLIWAVLASGSAWWSLHQMELRITDHALSRGRFIFEMIESIRLWNARHGGVYAAVTEETPPNLYLDIPERDIVTPSGIQLTKVNPAYMTRQLASLIRNKTGTLIHITSLKPINPSNAPDHWEEDALRRLEKTGEEEMELVRTSGAPVYRYMAPLTTKKPCLQCHAQQGYEIGDIRGGISVSFAAGPMLAELAENRSLILLFHVAVWLLLSGLSLFAFRHLRRHILALNRARGHQEELVAHRTRELRDEVHERRQAENRLRLILASSGEGIMGVDTHGVCTFCNARAAALLGYASEEQVVGLSLPERVHPFAPREGQVCSLARIYTTGESLDIDNRSFRRQDGSELIVELRARPIRENGGLSGTVLNFSDISARYAAERELRKLSLALEQSPESVVITDVKGNIEYVNRSFEKITGYDGGEVMGKNPRIMQSGLTPRHVYPQLWSTLLAGKPWRGEFVNRRKNGEVFWEKAAIAPVFDDRNDITHFVAVKEDITARKALEQQIWQQANFDPLTGLPNRNLLYDRFHQAVARARRAKGELALMYLDLDGFKPVNDRLGHEAGDQVLIEVAERLQSCIRQQDSLARLGGDEFIILLTEGVDQKNVSTVAEKILSRLAEPWELGRETVRVSASIGIALYPDNGGDMERLLISADSAMYLAKQHGKGSYRFVADPVTEHPRGP